MFGDIGKIMKMAGEMKRNMPAMKEKLEASTYAASAGEGAVQATVNGKLQLTDLQLSEELLKDAQSLAMAEDLIKAAISAAQADAADAAEAAMKELTGGIDIPGLM